MIQLVSVDEKQYLAEAKALFITYGIWRSHDAALGDFQKELDELPGKYAMPEGLLLLAMEAGKAVGCIAYQKLSSQVCEMKRMFVLEDYRKKGIGRMLVNELLSKAKKNGYVTMRLDTHPRMKSAHILYQNMGFYEIDRYNQNPTPGIRFFERAI